MDNLQTMRGEFARLTPGQREFARDWLLGLLAGRVDPAIWAELTGEALATAERTSATRTPRAAVASLLDGKTLSGGEHEPEPEPAEAR